MPARSTPVTVRAEAIDAGRRDADMPNRIRRPRSEWRKLVAEHRASVTTLRCFDAVSIERIFEGRVSVPYGARMQSNALTAVVGRQKARELGHEAAVLTTIARFGLG
jgi:hypothetical protein